MYNSRGGVSVCGLLEDLPPPIGGGICVMTHPPMGMDDRVHLWLCSGADLTVYATYPLPSATEDLERWLDRAAKKLAGAVLISASTRAKISIETARSTQAAILSALRLPLPSHLYYRCVCHCGELCTRPRKALCPRCYDKR